MLEDNARLLMLARARGVGGGVGLKAEPLDVQENGTYTAPAGKAYSPVTVNVPTGGGGGNAGDVTFYDYDGTVVESFTAAEFANLEAMPENPSHAGLTSKGWNWTISDAKAYVSDCGKLNIGQMYVTDDGATRLHITIPGEGRMTPALHFTQTVSQGVTVDWGDGSAPDTSPAGSGTALQSMSHTYAAPGDYVISVIPAEGCTMGLGQGTSSGYQFFSGNSATQNQNAVYRAMLTAVEIGAGVKELSGYAFYYYNSLSRVMIPTGVTGLGTYAFNNCNNLLSVTIPSGVTSIGSYAFGNCRSLTSAIVPKGLSAFSSSIFANCNNLGTITVPPGMTSIGGSVFNGCWSLASVTIPSGVNYIDNSAFNGCYSLKNLKLPAVMGSVGFGNSAFSNCYSLTSVTIPSGVTYVNTTSSFSNCYCLSRVTFPDSLTGIGDSMFNGCWSLASVTIPSGVTSIGRNAFASCAGLKEVRLLSATPPTLLNAGVFSSVPSDCVFYVPADSLEDYKAAANWSTYASQMVGV